jgi:hypothetical protein
MKPLSLLFFAMIVGLLFFLEPIQAQDATSTFELQKTIQLPMGSHPLTSFDISWVDTPSQTYFLADCDNKSIDIVNAKTDTFVKLSSQVSSSTERRSLSPITMWTPNAPARTGSWKFRASINYG